MANEKIRIHDCISNPNLLIGRTYISNCGEKGIVTGYETQNRGYARIVASTLGERPRLFYLSFDNLSLSDEGQLIEKSSPLRRVDIQGTQVNME